MTHRWRNGLSFILFMAMATQMRAAHFRGGTISWKLLQGTTVRFDFKMGWTAGRGPGCDPSKIGQFVNGMSSSYWVCKTGCLGLGQTNIANVNYNCLAANNVFEQGQGNFTYTFLGKGPFEVSFDGGSWIRLTNNKGAGNWHLGTTVDLRVRDDTAAVNSSPVSQSKPTYDTQYNCQVVLKIPATDADGDRIKCRWSSGTECISICNALPGAVLDEDKCMLTFNTTARAGYIKSGIYAVAVTIEDYPRTTMKMGGITYTPTDVISSIPLQFLVKSIPASGPCDDVPRFLPPTPAEQFVITVEEGNTVTVDLVADNGNDTSVKVATIDVTGPVTMKKTPTAQVPKLVNTFKSTITWKTTHSDIGQHIICANVENANGKAGDERCFNVEVVPKGCQGTPCKNGGKCVTTAGNYTCICRPGFSGSNCLTNIDDCTPNACPTGLYCQDGINSHTCINFTTTTTMITPTSPGIARYLCPLKYPTCRCRFTSHKHRYLGWPWYSRILRDVAGLIYGLSFGLVLSVITVWSCRGCQGNSGNKKPRDKRRKVNRVNTMQ